MAERAITLPPKTFAELTAQVRTALITGQAHVDRAYLETYRTTGRLIDAHLLLFKERAGYGEKVIPRLARELEVNERLLYRCLRFVREYPILTGRSELSWAHYRLLIEVADRTQRKALETAARKNHWKSEELERRVRALNAINVTPADPASNDTDTTATPDLLKPKRGTPGFYPLVSRTAGPGADAATALAVDLGFKMFLPLASLPGPALRGAKAGDIVHVDAEGRLTFDAQATKADLFTYRALEVRVVDGDTLAVTLDLPPFNHIDKKLRLRGLNCPELDTAAGKAAKRFVQALIRPETEVIVTTTKPDKYDRYLADVFLISPADPLKGESPQLKASDLNPTQPPPVAQLPPFDAQPDPDRTVVFLNNALLENAHAVRMDPDAPFLG
jgi:hypothetical protein